MPRWCDLQARLARVVADLDRAEAEEAAGQITDPAELARLAKQKRSSRAHEAWIGKKYGMSLAAYREMYAIQQGRCAICDAPHDRLSVDHCHSTERVRGLLCGRCNVALGLIREDLRAARRLAAYIEHRCIPSKQAGPLNRVV